MAKLNIGNLKVSWGKDKQADKSGYIDVRDRQFFYNLGMMSGFQKHHHYYSKQPTTYKKKLELVTESTASLFVLDLLASLFSLGQFRLYQKRGDEEVLVEAHPLLDLLNNPNPMQSASQFKYDYMFFRKLGTANMVTDSAVLGPNSSLYFLKNQYIEWPQWFHENKDSLFFSREAMNSLNERQITYKTTSQTIRFPMERVRQFHDISNGIKSWFDSPSRVDSLYKVIINADLALKSKATNADFAGKYLVGSQDDFEQVSGIPLDEQDEHALRRMMHSSHAVFPMVSNTQINRFVEDSSMLSNLGTAIFEDIFLVGRMIGIPRDVLEMFQASTYQNQEQAKASIIYYTCVPDSEDFCEGIIDMFDRFGNLRGQGYRLEMYYDHLPFVQTFMEKESESKQRLATAFRNLVQAGANQHEAAQYLKLEGLTEENFNEPFFNGQGQSEQEQSEQGTAQGVDQE